MPLVARNQPPRSTVTDMPVVALSAQTKISPLFNYPTSIAARLYGAKVRIYVEASREVDVYIVNSLQQASIVSVEQAKALGVMVLPRVLLVPNLEFTLPKEWATIGWNLIIGNPAQTVGRPESVAAVYYAVTDLG